MTTVSAQVPASPETPAVRFRRRPDVLWRFCSGAVVLLAPKADEPVVLTGSGAALWDLLATPADLGRLVSDLVQQFHVEPAVVQVDVERALTEMAANGLLEQLP